MEFGNRNYRISENVTEIVIKISDIFGYVRYLYNKSYYNRFVSQPAEMLDNPK